LYLGISLARLGRYAEAKAALDKAIELQPQAAVQHVFLALVHVHEGRPAEAVATAKKEPDEFWRNFALAFAEDANGNRTASDQALAALIKKEADSGPWQIAQIYAYRKQPDEAFKWMEHAYEVHDGGLQQMRTSTFLAPYEKDPRYEAMARKVRVWPG
jgi:serine/threonine-protein kinase